MNVGLNKLNISLDNFNAAASGKYNIGQIKLQPGRHGRLPRQFAQDLHDPEHEGFDG